MNKYFNEKMRVYYINNKEAILEKLRNKRIPKDNLGRIYRIFTDNKSYIGSTKNVPELRFRVHSNSYKYYKEGKAPYCTSYDVFDDGEPQFEILEKCPLNMLSGREEFYISKFRGTTVVVNVNEANKKTTTKLGLAQYVKEYQAKRRLCDPVREFKRLSRISV